MIINVILPSLKLSGGTIEAIKLADVLYKKYGSIELVTLWESDHKVSTNFPVKKLSKFKTNHILALFVYPLVFFNFLKFNFLRNRDTAFIFTHYATLPLMLAVLNRRKYVYVQDLEWLFVKGKYKSKFLKNVILFLYKFSYVIAANNYLKNELECLGVSVFYTVSIWADIRFYNKKYMNPYFDFAMVLRKGDHKRLDHYLNFIEFAIKNSRSVVVITTEDHIAELVKQTANLLVVRGDLNVLKDVFSRTKCFIHLSDHEGFGLPPLEAMGSGCIPICKDSGGVRNYMLHETISKYLFDSRISIQDFYTNAEKICIDCGDSYEIRCAIKKVFLEGVAISKNTYNLLSF